MVVVTVGVDDGDDNLDVVDDIVEVMLLGVVTLGTASAHTSIGDGCVSFARFSSAGFVSTRGKEHIDGFELSSDAMSVLIAFADVELAVVVVVSREFEFSVDVVDASGVHIELDE